MLLPGPSIGERNVIQLNSPLGPLLLALGLREKRNVVFYADLFFKVFAVISLEALSSFLHAELEARDEKPRESAPPKAFSILIHTYGALSPNL